MQPSYRGGVVRLAPPCAALLAWVSVACGAGATLNQSNGAKMGEALAFAGAAVVAQVAQSAAEARARNNASVTHSSTGASITPQCDNDGQYSCVTVTPPERADEAPRPPAPDMDEDEAREYVLGYVNGVRRLNAAGPVVRDEAVGAFAQAGSEELAADHRPGQHLADHARELAAVHAEVQGSPDGLPAGSLQDRIAEVLLRWMSEGPGGMHHDVLVRPGWRKMGVGLVTRQGRIYFTVDFSS